MVEPALHPLGISRRLPCGVESFDKLLFYVALDRGAAKLPEAVAESAYETVVVEFPVEEIRVGSSGITVFPDHAVFTLGVGEEIDGAFEIGPEVLHAFQDEC